MNYELISATEKVRTYFSGRLKNLQNELMVHPHEIRKISFILDVLSEIPRGLDFTIELSTYGAYHEEGDIQEVLTFEVPKVWLAKTVLEYGEISLEEFLNEYTWDDTIQIYQDAVAEGVVLRTWGRPYGLDDLKADFARYCKDDKDAPRLTSRAIGAVRTWLRIHGEESASKALEQAFDI